MLALRAIGPEDWRLWRDLRIAALTEAPYAFGSTLAEWQGEGDTEARWRDRLASVALNIVAHFDATPAGIVSCVAPNADGTADLISMWVAPAMRGRLVGDKLVGAVVEWAAAHGAARIALDVVAANERAIALYARHRFVDAGPGHHTPPHLSSERRMIRVLAHTRAPAPAEP